MRNLALLLLPAAMSAALLTGCTTAVREGLGVARGAKGLYAPIRQPQAASLSAYSRFKLGKISDDTGGKTPQKLWDYLPGKFLEQLAEKKLPDNPDGKTLLIRGTVLHYEDESILGLVLSPLEEVIVRTELVDASSGEVLGVANCIGRTTTRVNRGVEKKAEGLAKAFAAWLAALYQPEARPGS